MRKTLNLQIHFFFTCLLAFLLPVMPAVIPAVIALLALNWIAGEGRTHLFKKKDNLFYFLLLISFYLLYLIGMLWSKNLEYGLKDIETKLSLLIFPLIYFSSEKLNVQKISTVFMSLTWGCMTAALICLGYALFRYFHVRYLLAHNIWAWDYGINFFLKNRLSFLIHPSYISMYFLIAFAGLHWVNAKSASDSLLIKIIMPFTLSVFILLFSSKAGIISLFIWGIYLGWHSVFKEKKISPVVISAVSVTFVLLTLYISAPQFAIRINSTIHTLSENADVTNSEESTALRIAIWKASKEVIVQNIFIGTGTGDVKDELLKEYEKKGMSFALQERLNAHSQFLQTFMALGIPGIVLLCSGLFIPLYCELRKKNYLYVTFILLVVLNFTAESMLETQAGVVFYAFFNSLLLCSSKDQ